MSRDIVWPIDATHWCRICGAHWRENADGTWSAIDTPPRPGPCCDNAPMGLNDQILPIKRNARSEQGQEKKP